MRIDENYLRGDKVDGQIITSADFNELENIVKAAINANYDDIKKLQENPPNFYYFDGVYGENNTSVALFNEVCNRFTNNEPFVLVGRFLFDWYGENKEIVSPIQVKNFSDLEAESGRTVYSFTTPPIWLLNKYIVASVSLSGGTWGNFTTISPIKWSEIEGPSVNLKKIEGYNENKTQVIKNINGVLTWVDEV